MQPDMCSFMCPSFRPILQSMWRQRFFENLKSPRTSKKCAFKKIFKRNLKELRSNFLTRHYFSQYPGNPSFTAKSNVYNRSLYMGGRSTKIYISLLASQLSSIDVSTHNTAKIENIKTFQKSTVYNSSSKSCTSKLISLL